MDADASEGLQNTLKGRAATEHQAVKKVLPRCTRSRADPPHLDFAPIQFHGGGAFNEVAVSGEISLRGSRYADENVEVAGARTPRRELKPVDGPRVEGKRDGLHGAFVYQELCPQLPQSRGETLEILRRHAGHRSTSLVSLLAPRSLAARPPTRT